MIERKTLVDNFGASNIITEQAVLDTYAKDISFASPIRPELVVRVGSTDDIRRLVSLARETRTPLVPVSSGAPHFNGDTVPSIGGAIIVDMSGMKQIIRADRLNRVVMFEPGVNFGDLISACKQENMRLNMPLLPRQTKSVTASLLERQPVVMPCYHWDLPDPLNCVQIVYGTGDIFRTGAAAGPGTIEEQWAAGGAQVTPAGPTSASFYRMIGGAQGTMGVVCWSSARCELLPKVEEPYFAGASDLGRLMEMVHWLVRLRIPNECFILNKVDFASMVTTAGTDEFKRLKDRLPEWILFYNLAGNDYYPEDRVKAYAEDAWRIAQNAGAEPFQAIGQVSAFDFLKTVQAPAAEPYWKLRAKGASHDIFFLTNFQKVEKLIHVMQQVCEQAGYPLRDLGVYVQPLVQGANFHVEFNLFYNPDNAGETAMVRGLAANAVEPLIANGAFFSRPYGENVRAILNKDAASVQALLKVKSIFDPDKIMNPGKLCF